MRTRDRRPELMDDPGIDPAEHRRALRALSRLNAVSGVASSIRPHLLELAARHRPVRWLDVATGAGDIPVAVGAWCARRGIALDAHACDISPVALSHASRRAQDVGVSLTFHEADAIRGELPEGFHLATCNLFLHHVDEADVVRVLRALARSGARVLVNDLRRTRLGLALAWAASRVGTRSRVVHIDAVRSVRGAFTSRELGAMADEAGMRGHRIRHVWPQRMQLEWNRPS
ncbi:MAG: methyltransferase domain-containing protein [Planctomycetota bacterium]|nr:methyltransferase domain-containing protein [Planctomycetota bacterium]